MISLKKYMESQVEETLASALDSYRALTGAVGECGVQVHAGLGSTLQQQLAALGEQIQATATPQQIRETEAAIEKELGQWGKSTGEYISKTTEEIRGIVKEVAGSTQALAERDKRYAGQFEQIGKQLESAAALNDLSQMRKSLVESVRSVNASVELMVKEGEQSVAKLRAEVAQYQARLEEAERQASRDSLTGLHNRRSMERRIEQRMQAGADFAVLVIDLNQFKPVNDRYGHAAGDSLLKQFAHELGRVFRDTDTVGRLGGDEFVVALDGDSKEAEKSVARIQQWVLGDYTVKSGGKDCQIRLGASIGMAQYKRGETLAELLSRADADMYKRKTVSQRH